MSGLLVTLPLQLACSLINAGNLDYGNVNYVKDIPKLSQQIAFPAGYTDFPDIGVAYKYYENGLTWNAARKQCISEGGNLAVIDSFKKVEYLMGMKNRSPSIHTGVHRLFDNAEWISVKSGQPLNFIPWKPDANLAAGTGGCVALWYDGTGLSPWDCSKVLPAVCEIPIFKNHRTKTQIRENGTGVKSPRIIDARFGAENLIDAESTDESSLGTLTAA